MQNAAAARVAAAGGASSAAPAEAWPGPSPDEKSAGGARIGADFEIVSAGQTRRAGARSVELPLVLGNPEGETVTLRLTVSLDPLLDGDE